MIISTAAPGHARITGTIARGQSAHDTRSPSSARLPEPPRPADDSWAEGAACRSADAELFFAPDGEKIRDRDQREFNALGVCAVCPVKADCAAWTAANPDLTRYGIWGGLTEDDRGTSLSKKRATEKRRRARAVSKAVMASPTKTALERPASASATRTGAIGTQALSEPAQSAQRGCAAVAMGAPT